MIRTIRSNARHRSSKLCYSILERVKIRGWKGADGEERTSRLAVSRRGKEKKRWKRVDGEGSRKKARRRRYKKNLAMRDEIGE